MLQLALLLLLIAPLALVLAGAALFQRERRALLAIVRSHPCPTCGAPLSEPSVQLAEEWWAQRVADLKRQYPQSKLRLVRPLDAVCERCRSPMKLDSTCGTLQAITIDLSEQMSRGDEWNHPAR
jgi:hypothetical protein